MNTYEFTLKKHSQPVLPFFCQTQPTKTQITSVRRIDPSFRIGSNQSFAKKNYSNLINPKSPELPSFINSKTAVAINCVRLIPQEIFENRINFNHFKPKAAAKKRFWWQWLLWGICALLILPSTSDAQNLLSKAKIYLNLESSVVSSLPESGRSYLQSSQASDFQRAIQQAEEVPFNSPFFAQAQADIERWSQVILDIARGRASQNDFTGAIAAAQLILEQKSPLESLRQETQVAIQQWQLQAKSTQKQQNLIAMAQNLIEPNQASSYNRAIAILRKVPVEANNYSLAQKLIGQWSKQIYLIAQERASQGDFVGAIAAAHLIPKDSSDYEKANDFIMDWQENLSTELLFLSNPNRTNNLTSAESENSFSSQDSFLR